MTAVVSEDRAVIWHDVECGAYAADLATWESLATAAPGPTLELGCGTGRVVLRLARAGCATAGLDADPRLLEALRDRAAREGLHVETHLGDARAFDLAERFGLITAPMQLTQLLDEDARRSMLATAARHLLPGARIALAISARPPEPWRAGPGSPAPSPDVREIQGWIFSSLPLGMEIEDDAVAVRRLRQAVSPDGLLDEHEHTVRLFELTPERLERDARDLGLRPEARWDVPATADHLGSVVVVMGADG